MSEQDGVKSAVSEGCARCVREAHQAQELRSYFAARQEAVMADQVEPGDRLRNTSDQHPGTVQWVDILHGCIGVTWDDGTSSTESLDEDQRWELTGGTGHVCTRARCRCPDDGEQLAYAPAWGEHACPRVGCPYAHGPGPGGG